MFGLNFRLLAKIEENLVMPPAPVLEIKKIIWVFN